MAASLRLIAGEKPAVASQPQMKLGYGLRAALMDLVRAMAEAEARRIVEGK